MVQKDASLLGGHVQVQFELPSSFWADRICVVGDFNNWNPKAMPMRQGRDGNWRAVIDLPANHRYEFRYLVDGMWRTDGQADGFAPSKSGVDNSIIDTSLFQHLYGVRLEAN